MPYYGKPENQRNPKAKRQDPPGKAPATTTEANNPKPQTSDKQANKAPPSLAKPTHLQTGPVKKDLKELAPNLDAIFSKETSLYEVAPKAGFTPTFAAFNQIVSSTYQTYAAKNVLTAKTLSPGMLNYYCACMIWFRIIDLKRQNSQVLTPTEHTIYELIKLSVFSVPKPVSIYLKSIGTITSVTEQTLSPVLPDYPNAGGHAMWSPQIDAQHHNHYELFPTVGIAAEVLQAELLPTNAAWEPSVVPPGTIPTNNLQCYFQPVEQKNEVKQIIIGSGVNANDIGATIPNSDINIPLLQAISSALDRLDVFPLESTCFGSMEPNGSPSQLVQIVKTDNDSPVSIPAGEVSIYDYTRDSSGTVGMAIVYQQNVIREGPLANNAYVSWCCLRNRDGQNIVDGPWYANRNALYQYPPQYCARIFTTGSRNGTVFRTDVFEELAK